MSHAQTRPDCGTKVLNVKPAMSPLGAQRMGGDLRLAPVKTCELLGPDARVYAFGVPVLVGVSIHDYTVTVDPNGIARRML